MIFLVNLDFVSGLIFRGLNKNWNIRERPWWPKFPQGELFFSYSAHPNLVAFITHGGMNRILEAVNHGKPMIAVPLFGDQNRNTQAV